MHMLLALLAAEGSVESTNTRKFFGRTFNAEHTLFFADETLLINYCRMLYLSPKRVQPLEVSPRVFGGTEHLRLVWDNVCTSSKGVERSAWGHVRCR